jgi:NADH-quinone oxidoreductase subunit M
MRQSDMKRLLAYSSISQVGYMLIGVASSAYLGFLGV